LSWVSVVSDQPDNLFMDTPATRALYGRDVRLNDVSIVTPDTIYGITGLELRDIDINVDVGGDIKTAAGRHDLAQSLISRIRTRRGELAWAGDQIHSRYGCDVWRLLGEGNTPNNRSLAKSYIVAAIMEEPRIAGIVSVDVKFFVTTRNCIYVSATVTPINSTVPLNLVFNIAA
jgi:phage baseplate assembly protein W